MSEENEIGSKRRRSSSGASSDRATKLSTDTAGGTSDTPGAMPTLQDSGKNVKRRGRPGRPRIHALNDGSTDSQSTASLKDSSVRSVYGTNGRSVNEVIPKVWVISNFSMPIMAQVAWEVLKKGDKVVLGCCPGGENEPELLRQADRLRQRCPDRCIVVELDVK